MILSKVAAGLTAAGIALGAGAALGAPLPTATTSLGIAPGAFATPVQYYGDDYGYPPPPRAYRRAPPPPPGYYGRPSYGPPPPPPGYYGRAYNGPSRGYSSYRYGDYVEDQKDAVKDYRRTQKEILKDQVRGWNRAHGF